VAIKPDGGERWRRKIDESILTSPAVNSETGDIFVVGQSHSELGLRSRILHLDSGAGLHESTTTEFVTLAAPKLWDHFVFVPAIVPGAADASTLLVFDQNNLLVPVGQIRAGCIDLICGSGPDPLSLIASIAKEFVKGFFCLLNLGDDPLCEIGSDAT